MISLLCDDWMQYKVKYLAKGTWKEILPFFQFKAKMDLAVQSRGENVWPVPIPKCHNQPLNFRTLPQTR